MNVEPLLQAFERARESKKRGLIVTGPIGSGKTQLILALAENLRRKGIAIAGVASPRVLQGGETVGYLVQDLQSGKEVPLCSLNPPGVRFRRFFFSPEALAFANAVLTQAARQAEVIVVDEVGPLELDGGGFAPGLRLSFSSPAFLLLTVRPPLVEEVRRLGPGEFAVLTLPERPTPQERGR
ncbi:MAG: nucleoside-triphosphatase [Candidatus Bipolaricaulaceae bacterium]